MKSDETNGLTRPDPGSRRSHPARERILEQFPSLGEFFDTIGDSRVVGRRVVLGTQPSWPAIRARIALALGAPEETLFLDSEARP